MSIDVSITGRDLSEEIIRRALLDANETVLAAAVALPHRDHLEHELSISRQAAARGYFLPDEEEWVKLRYSQYLSLRASLLSAIEEIGGLAGHVHWQWRARMPLFITAFAAACILLRANRFVVDFASRYSVVWKKLDEEDRSSGIPAKSFTTIYRALTSPKNQLRFLYAADHYARHKAAMISLRSDPVMRPMIDLLESEEPYIERRRRDAVKRRICYRWFAFLRRHRYAWKHVMFGMFEISGRAIAELRQPGIKPQGAPKRITPELRREILPWLKPGDVFVTRHDDALSNLFLPGFWPHAALYLGESNEPTVDDGDLSAADGPPVWFLEAKKDGVKVRPMAETLALDALVVLRPPLADADIEKGIRRALTHRGKSYDFLFDFRTTERLACTEVIYRGYHGVGPIRFHLKEAGGRLCLPAEAFLDQALACGFELILTAGLEGDVVLTGHAAEQAFFRSRRPSFAGFSRRNDQGCDDGFSHHALGDTSQ
jgi:hypothetical protein